jgi:DNA-binding transcriptional MerR regulator/methylmalonyl-CoA mutase cobalamin-binding subunit
MYAPVMVECFRHPIRVAAIRTGLSSHVIRAWERRYGAITPQRTDTNRRLYSDEEIHRLQLLRRATRAGHSIGQIARLTDQDLEALVAQDESYRPAAVDRPAGRSAEETPSQILASSVDAVTELDPVRLDRLLSLALVRFNPATVLDEILLPLMTFVGEKWQQGSLKIVHEHFASGVVRNVLGGLAGASQSVGPVMVVATPVGQIHEFGALSVAVAAGVMGWSAVYLGPNLPAEEIAAAADAHKAAAVALSIIHPGDDPRVSQELRKLRRLIGETPTLFVGGRAATSYQEAIQACGGVLIRDLQDFRSFLENRDRSEISESG